VPRWWCDCAVCEEARTIGKNARTRPSVLVEGSERLLIDAAPEFRVQSVREGLRDIDTVLITHAHNDHVLGLGDIGDRARRTKKPCPVYAPAEVLPLLKQRFSYMTQGSYPKLVPFLALEEGTFAGYRLTSIRVPHGYNGFAYGFRFDGQEGSWAYIPDSLNISDLSPWYGLDLLVLGTSFYRESAPVESRSVYDDEEALKLMAELEPRRVVFTHLGHGVDARKPAPKGTHYAFDGMAVKLPC
jgi:phosphoribosyl 1,2-cyclic phosphate phosphodiesterase